MKKLNFYDENGYLNMPLIKSLPYSFIFIVGGRGTGKTYGAIRQQFLENEKYIYMRRLQAQADMVFNDMLSPFQPVCQDLGLTDWWPEKIPNVKSVAGLYRHEYNEEKEKAVPVGEPMALLLSLSTIANLRGISGDEYKTLYLDEFIPQKQERPIKDEADAFFNAYETINRNRELQGQKPLKAILMSNSNDLGNPYFIELGLVARAQRMRERGIEFYGDKDHDRALIILSESPISEKKKDTALYKLTEGSEFSKMSLGNDWSAEEVGRTSARKIIEYRALVTIGEITIYKHKSRREYYVTTYKTGHCPEYGTGDIARQRFQRVYLWLWREYMANCVIFEEYLCEILFRKYFG